MIFHKFWAAFVAQINKVANLFWEADPIAQMRYEYDSAVEQLKEGRTGLEQYRGLVERVTRQVAANRSHVHKLEAETKAYLKAGDRATAAKFASWPGQTVKSFGPLTVIASSVTVKVVVQLALLPDASVAVTVMVCAPVPTSVPAAGD